MYTRKVINIDTLVYLSSYIQNSLKSTSYGSGIKLFPTLENISAYTTDKRLMDKSDKYQNHNHMLASPLNSQGSSVILESSSPSVQWVLMKFSTASLSIFSGSSGSGALVKSFLGSLPLLRSSFSRRRFRKSILWDLSGSFSFCSSVGQKMKIYSRTGSAIYFIIVHKKPLHIINNYTQLNVVNAEWPKSRHYSPSNFFKKIEL